MIKNNPSLRVTIVQPDLKWEDRVSNLDKISGMLKNTGETDVVLLPEMFSTGFSMNVEPLAEEPGGPTVSWMKEKAARSGAVFAGSLIIREDSRFFNRFLWVRPDGKTEWYDKRHLFTIGEEHLRFTPGDRRITVEWQGWKIRLLICYDLRFPVWSRNHDDYDLLIYTASWPAARHHVWKNLLTARALENQCYCIGVNRVGKDGMGIHYNGDSGCIGARGEAVWMGQDEKIQTIVLDMGQLNAFREKFPVLKDRDRFDFT